jgi:predicted dinucleotide-binding enzyme
VFAARGKKPRPSLLYCGDDARAKKVAARLIGDVGYDPVDVGALRMSRYLEPFAMVVAQIAYEGQGGPEVVYRFERLRA